MIYIIADDLTGANDTGVQFAKRGYAAQVAILSESGDQQTILAGKCDALVLDTETRDAAPDAARSRLQGILRQLSVDSEDILYKKVDSTLRGNIGVELRECLTRFRRDLCLFTPSFPANQRITVGGRLFVGDRLVGATEYYSGALSAEDASDVAKLLERDLDVPVALVDLNTVRSGAETLRQAFEAMFDAGKRVIALDAVTDDDLRTILHASFGMTHSFLYAGSAGLANALAALLPEKERPASSNALHASPALIVSGSRRTIAQQQIEYAATRLNIERIRVDVEQISTHREQHLAQCVEMALDALRRGCHGVIVPELPLSGFQTLTGVLRESELHIRAFLGEAVARIIAQFPLKNLILTGGDTAVGVCAVLRISTLNILDELLPGVPRMTGRLADGTTLNIITKAGGFGDEQTLYRLINKNLAKVLHLRKVKGTIMPISRPLIGISVGDPAGIGAEVTVKALALPEMYDLCRPLVIADAELLRHAAKFSNVATEIRAIESPQAGRYQAGMIDALDMRNVDMTAFRHKVISAEYGRASFDYVKKVIELALAREIDATVTGPIHKEALHLAGVPYAGHTEIYAALTQTKQYAMMLMHEQFRVIHVSTHVALRDACERVKMARVLTVIRLAHETLQRLGIRRPRIAVAGLNPHAGEGGLFGREEIEEIAPAIRQAVEEGIAVEGAFPADTIFSKMAGGQYDIVVTMYHDQGHIPTKLLGFRYDQQTDSWDTVSGVNITCGLPIIRVSVDHGTAFDKAGEGRANPGSMIQAIRIAAELSKQAVRHFESV